jgi:hypothetical protein
MPPKGKKPTKGGKTVTKVAATSAPPSEASQDLPVKEQRLLRDISVSRRSQALAVVPPLASVAARVRCGTVQASRQDSGHHLGQVPTPRR